MNLTAHKDDLTSSTLARWYVHHGNLPIGCVDYYHAGPPKEIWSRNLTFTFKHGPHNVMGHGLAKREEAVEGLKDAFRTWLEWVGLETKNRSPEERG